MVDGIQLDTGCNVENILKFLQANNTLYIGQLWILGNIPLIGLHFSSELFNEKLHLNGNKVF